MSSFIFIYSLTAFTISLLSLPVLIKLLRQWKIFDSPGKHKIHKDFKPSMGGISILLGVVFTLLISFPFTEWVNLKYFFIALAVMFITGLRDDVLTLDPISKLLGQLLPVIIIVVFGKVALSSLYDIYDLPWPQWITWLVTIFTIVILTNAFNLIDGLDGLAGSVALIVLLFFGVWFYALDALYLSILAFSFASSTIAFLIFNWQPSKIFMGDTGTLAIGLVLAFLTINFINLNYALPTTSVLRFTGSISTAVCVMIIPVFDTVRVIILRISRLKSPFKADRNHLHHQFINLGFSHAQTTLFIAAINGIFILLAYLLRMQSDIVILTVATTICLLINWILSARIKKHQTYSGE